MIDSAAKAKIFQADLANIVRKTKAGKTLTKAEREIVANAEPTSAGPGRPRSEAPTLPIYDSIAQCAAATGIPDTVIKRAKRSGCDAFRSNRVDLAKLLQWIFNHDDTDAADWGAEFEKWRAKRERIKHDRDAGVVLDRDAIRTDILAAEAVLFAELDRIFCSEMPPVLKGRDEITIRAIATDHVEKLKATLHAKFATAGERAPAP